jgi:hypothetical protein
LGRFISADPFEGEPSYPVTWNSYLYANGNPLLFIDRAGYWGVSDIADYVVNSAKEAWNETKFAAGLVTGAALSVAEGAKALAEVAVDAEKAKYGDPEAMLRMAQRGKAIAGAVTHPSDTIKKMKDHVVGEYEGAKREYAEGNYYTAGVVTGKLAADTVGTVAGAYGAAKGTAALARGAGALAREAGAAAQAEKMAAATSGGSVDAAAVKQLETAAAPPPAGTGARTAPNVPEAAPAVTVEGPQVGASGKAADASGTVVPEQSATPKSGDRTLVVPIEKADVFGDWAKAAAEGTLVRTDPKTVRGSGFRKRLESEQGPAPEGKFDADHKVELCVGGADCASSNGQWLGSTPNRASGPKVYNQVKNDPLGTVYRRVELEKKNGN